MSDTRHTRLLIIGSGPAGYTAAVYGARAMLKPILIQGIQPGGQLTITTEVENWPGDVEVQGPALMERMEAHARATGAEVVADHIARLELGKRPFTAIGDGGTVYTADAVILATGAQAKWLGLPSEERFKGFGVSACATCDGFFYRGREVVVIGGGNTAVEEALFLTNFATKVTLVHRRDELRAEKILQERLFAPSQDRGDLAPRARRGAGRERPARGDRRAAARPARPAPSGWCPATGSSSPSATRRRRSWSRGSSSCTTAATCVTQAGSTATSIPGVFAAGDIADPIYRQAVTSAGMGCMAALDAERFLAAQHEAGEPAPDAAQVAAAE